MYHSAQQAREPLIHPPAISRTDDTAGRMAAGTWGPTTGPACYSTVTSTPTPDKPDQFHDKADSRSAPRLVGDTPSG